MSHWKILDTGVRTAQENMRLDSEMFSSLEDQCILHFYDWSGPSATYGYFVDPAAFLQMEEARARGLQLARRPTGGGVVFHIWDIAFSVLVPSSSPHFSQNTLENYRFVNEAVQRAAEEFLGRKNLQLTPTDALALDSAATRFCMARPTKYDLVWEGRKIAGAAQRQGKKGFLHQGTIALQMPPDEYLEALLLPGTRVLEGMKAHTFPLLPDDMTLEEGRQIFRQLLQKYLIGS